MADMLAFQVGQLYTRKEIAAVAGLPSLPKGGAWFTGHVRQGDAHFVFYGVGIPGRTGHDYANHFDGEELIIRGRTGSHKNQPSIRALGDHRNTIYVFWRDDARQPFTYAGLGKAVSLSDDVPVEIRWRFSTAGLRSPARLPEEIDFQESYPEGATKSITVNAYERNPRARQACINHYGPQCFVCEMDFFSRYGDLGSGFIHVHHLTLLAHRTEAYQVDPVKDLRPVCPNCHAMLHRTDPPIEPEALRQLLRG